MGTSSTSSTGAAARLLYIDNLRWTMILLVISMHAADTYSPFGNWYFVDREPASTATILAFGAWQMYLQSFFMGLLFFVAGYFVPASFDRKGPRAFLRDRAIRLGIPVLLYMFVIGPMTEYFFAHSWTSTEPTSFANEWIKHIRNGEFLQENGPLWFCLALLIFSAVYAVCRSFPRQNAPVQQTPPPSNAEVCLFAVLIAIVSFVVRGLFSGSFLNMHLGDFPQYIFLFVAGILSARRGWLPQLSFEQGQRWLFTVLPAGFVCWLLLMYDGVIRKPAVHWGPWSWQRGAFCFWEAFTCIAISFGLLVIYRQMFPSQGRIAKFLSANAFSVYVFHPPVMIGIARLMHGLSWPPLLKFSFLTCAAAIVTFALSEVLFRRIPLLRRVL